MLENRTERQIVFYDRGLGTGWRKITGNIGGMGISRNILDCYEFIFEHYCAGDKVFLFGFSRGAATVRSLSSFIHLFGMLPRSRPELIGRAYKIYKIEDKEKRDDRAQELIDRHHTMWCKIEFLGVWDTVAALGLPFKALDQLVDMVWFWRHKFQDFTLSESVIHARHALAIDEERKVFHPTLFEKNLSHQILKQVWFCGAHSDIGGGYENHQLSDIPLLWMMTEAKEQGLLIYDDHKVELSPNADGEMHDPRSGIRGRLFRKRVRSWDSNKLGPPMLHGSVSMRTRNRENEEAPPYDAWILGMEHEVEPWPENLRAEGRYSGTPLHVR
jgi:uncharacterized protein (DUF2235 family)